MHAFIYLGTLALLVEFAVITRCVVCGIPFGRSLCGLMLAQVELPLLLLAILSIWGFVSLARHGIEPLDSAACEGGWICIGCLFWLEFCTTILAGSVGISRFFVAPPAAPRH